MRRKYLHSKYTMIGWLSECILFFTTFMVFTIHSQQNVIYYKMSLEEFFLEELPDGFSHLLFFTVHDSKYWRCEWHQRRSSVDTQTHHKQRYLKVLSGCSQQLQGCHWLSHSFPHAMPALKSWHLTSSWTLTVSARHVPAFKTSQRFLYVPAPTGRKAE